MEQRSDEQLIEAFLAGDSKAFDHIVIRHRKRLTYVARKYVNNDSDAQDIVQEALFKAARGLSGYRREAKLVTWLSRLVKNAGYDHLNHRANRENASLDSAKFDPERNLHLSYKENVVLRLHLEEALQTLNPDQREALLLTEIMGYSLADVAEMQGVEVGTIKSRRSRAKQALRAAVA